MNNAPNTSCGSLKRKQPDEDEVLLREGPLTEQPIENEYEHLDDEDDEDQSEDEQANSSKKKSDYEHILKAQEPATITQYDDIKITPFNLEEELEDGEFDKAGNFLFKKETKDEDEELNDTWAESIDWAAIERKEREQAVTRKTEEQPSSLNEPKTQKLKEETNPGDRLSCYKQMLRIMQPDETVQKTIRRLGCKVPKRRQNQQRCKTNNLHTNKADESADIVEVREKLDMMIELAHQLLEDGDIDIYQKSFEDLEEAIN